MPVNNQKRPGLVWLAGQDVANQGQADISLAAFTAYRHKRIIATSVIPATDGASLLLRLSTDGGATFPSGASDYVYAYTSVFDDATGGNAGASGGSILLAQALGNAANEWSEYVIDLYDTTDAAKRTSVIYNGLVVTSAGRLGRLAGSGSRAANADTDALRLIMGAGNLSLRWDLYGWNQQ